MPHSIPQNTAPSEPPVGQSRAEEPSNGGQGEHPRSVRDLPYYTRSLLRISVPIVVTLARKKQSLGRILELGPGAIIQFDKSCEEMLELDVGRRPVATGEAVKVGDKFGLRITSIVLPGERFRRVQKAISDQAARP